MPRPVIKVSPTIFDKVLFVAALLLLVSLWMIVLYNYASLPEIIPIHYNASGEVDGYGNKIHILVLPLVATFLFGLLSYLIKFPHKYNYLTRITPENAARQYKYAARSLRAIRLSVVIIFLLIAYETLQHTRDTINQFGKWTLPFMLAIIFVPMFYYMIKSSSKS